MTALHIAAKYGRISLVKALLATVGILVNEQTDHGMTALDLALCNGNRKCAELLWDTCP